MFKRYKGSYLSYFLMYNFYYLSWALFSALISVYLLDKGFKPSDVSLVVSFSFFSSMVAQPLIGVISDKYNSKLVNTVLLCIASLGGLYFAYATTLFEITFGYSLVMLLVNGTSPVVEKMATTSSFQYGKIRIWGTIGYAVGSQLSGLIYEKISPQTIFLVFAFTMMLSILGLLGVRDVEQPIDPKQDRAKVGFMSLFKNRQYLFYIVIASIFYGVTNIGHTYTSSMLQSEGIDVSLVSTILSFAVICESPVVFFSGKFMDRIGNKQLLYIAYGAMIVQYLIYGFSFPMSLKILVTLLFKHAPGMLFIMINLKVVNTLIDAKAQITALAIVQTVRSLASIVFQNIGGTLLDFTTYQNLFLFMLAMMVIGMVLIVFAKIPSGNDKRLFS